VTRRWYLALPIEYPPQVLQCGDGYSAEFWTNGLWKVTECSLSPHDGLEDVSDLIADVEHLEEPMIRVTMFVG
jgi:hypothetical protein